MNKSGHWAWKDDFDLDPAPVQLIFHLGSEEKKREIEN